MQKFPDFPPYYYLIGVLQHCPKAGLLFMQLWEKADDDLKLKVKKNEIIPTFQISPTRFRNDLGLLVREGLLQIDDHPTYYKISLESWEDDE